MTYDLDFGRFSCDGIASGKRNLSMDTNVTEDGNIIHITYIKNNALDMLDWLEEIGRINKSKKESLRLMLDSSDRESFDLAITIIQTEKLNQNGNNIHS